jgi:hypothetical protein
MVYIVAEEERKDIGERLTRIEVLLEANYRDLFNRVKKLEDNQSWLSKTVFAAIIVAIVALYFK